MMYEKSLFTDSDYCCVQLYMPVLQRLQRYASDSAKGLYLFLFAHLGRHLYGYDR